MTDITDKFNNAASAIQNSQTAMSAPGFRRGAPVFDLAAALQKRGIFFGPRSNEQ